MGFISSHQVVLENKVVRLGFKNKVPFTIASDNAKLFELPLGSKTNHTPLI